MIIRITFVGAIFGLLSFGAGFIFGALRELILIPVFGQSAGHMIEFSLMLIAVTGIAAVLSRRGLAGAAASAKLAVGIIGAFLLVAIESSLALGVLRRPLTEYLASYDVTVGALFPLGLLWMAVAPMVVGRQ